MYSNLPVPAQLAALFDAHEAISGVPEGDLSILDGRIDGTAVLVVAFDYATSFGSMGTREAAQIVYALHAARRSGQPLVFLINTSGVRVTEGNHGIAALRSILRAGLDACLDGVPMLALIARHCFGGGSVLASLCEQRVVNASSLFGMSGPKLIEQISGAADLVASDKAAVAALLGGTARAATSAGFRLVDDDPAHYRTALVEWLARPHRQPPMLAQCVAMAEELRDRLRNAGRWQSGTTIRPWGSAALGAVVQRLIRRRSALERSGAFVKAMSAGGESGALLGLIRCAYADAVDTLHMIDAALDLPSTVERLVILLDCESHAAASADERVVFSEYLGALSVVLRLLHRRGVSVELVVIGESGGGIFAALSGAAGTVSMLSSARMRVLPTAAMAAINKTEDAGKTTPAHALETGAVDQVLDDTQPPLPMRDNDNFYAALVRSRADDVDRVCLETESGETYTFADLDRLSAQYAHALLALGCARDDRVAVQVEKSAHALALFLACLRAGLIYLPLNTAYQRAELSHFLADAQPKVFVCAQSAVESMRSFARSLDIPRVEGMDASGGGSLTQLAAAKPHSFATVYRSADDIATIMYTSGTTGRSKGAMISHRAAYFCADGLAKHWGFKPHDVLLHALPIFHAHGLFISSCVALISGGTLLFHRKFDLDATLQALPRVTAMMAVPTFYHRLLSDDRLTADLCSHIRLFTSGSAALSAQVHQAFVDRVGHPILERYGATETMILTSNPLHGERRPGSVGMPLPGVELRIAGEDDMPLPKGKIGMIQVRGPGLFSGYWQLPEKTAEAFSADGFFRTGDLGSESEDGYVTITGRAKDMIISGGYNVYPIEIESVLNTHDAVSEAAVIGVPHADFGEAVTAIVTLRPGAPHPVTGEELIAWVRARLANYKVPKFVAIVDQLPRNAMGKMQKNTLRETYAHLGQSAAAKA